MKVLLTRDVEKLGAAGEIKQVSGGFGRNYLIPKGYAVIATRGQVKQAEERATAQRRRDEANRRDAEAVVAKISGVTLRFVERVGELDRLYGSVTNVDVAEKLQQQTGVAIDRRRVDLDDPIKRIGIYPVRVRVATGLDATINVVVEGEDGQVAAPEPPALTPPDTTSAE
jgi:large subunit ribosomal protein L9